MFKLEPSKRVYGTYDLTCHYYIHAANMHSFLYAIHNKPLEELARYLEGIHVDDTIQDAVSVVLLTNKPAYITDQGVVSAVA